MTERVRGDAGRRPTGGFGASSPAQTHELGEKAGHERSTDMWHTEAHTPRRRGLKVVAASVGLLLVGIFASMAVAQVDPTTGSTGSTTSTASTSTAATEATSTASTEGTSTASTEAPSTEPSSTNTSPAAAAERPGPTIASDKDDYAPGELVTLRGLNWQPGET